MILRKSPEKYGYACIARFSCFSLTRSVMALPSKIAREVWLCMYCSIFMLLSDTECHGASNENTGLRAITSNIQPQKIRVKVRRDFQTVTHFIRTDNFTCKRHTTDFRLLLGIFGSGGGTN